MNTTQPVILTTTYKHNMEGFTVEVTRVSTRNNEVKFYREGRAVFMDLYRFSETYTIWGN